MDKASKALRRSSVRLKSLNTGHSDLNMIVSDLRDMCSTLKAFVTSQTTAWQDMVKWASKERNSALQESFQHFYELNSTWCEVHREFIGDLKKFKHDFEIILEGEQNIDKSKAHLTSCEQKEVKLLKELRKANSKRSVDDIKACEDKLVEAKASIKAAQLEVNGKVSDHEAVKMSVIKEGLLNLSECYLAMAEKLVVIFEAHRDIAKGLPDIDRKDIQDIKYTGSEAAKRSVMRAKEIVHCYKKAGYRIGAPPCETSPPPPPLPTQTSPPPPYRPSPGQFQHTTSSSYFVSPAQTFRNLQDSRYSEDNVEPGPWDSRHSYGFQNNLHSPRYDVPPRENYENIPGAIGGLLISEQHPAT